jgi:hypothetical protein
LPSPLFGKAANFMPKLHALSYMAKMAWRRSIQPAIARCESTLLLLCAGFAVHLAADVVIGSNSSQAVGDGRRAVT